MLLGQPCPLLPRLYRQGKGCQATETTFRRNLHLLDDLIRRFEPVAHTSTDVLADSWSTGKPIWRAARERGFLITSGWKANRSLRVEDENAPGGWRWPLWSEYAAMLPAQAWQTVTWPNGQPKTVFVHVVSTRVRKL